MVGHWETWENAATSAVLALEILLLHYSLLLSSFDLSVATVYCCEVTAKTEIYACKVNSWKWLELSLASWNALGWIVPFRSRNKLVYFFTVPHSLSCKETSERLCSVVWPDLQNISAQSQKSLLSSLNLTRKDTTSTILNVLKNWIYFYSRRRLFK